MFEKCSYLRKDFNLLSVYLRIMLLHLAIPDLLRASAENGGSTMFSFRDDGGMLSLD